MSLSTQRLWSIKKTLAGECAHLYINSEPWVCTFWRLRIQAEQMVRWWIETTFISYIQNPEAFSTVCPHIILPSSDYILEQWIALIDASLVIRCVEMSPTVEWIYRVQWRSCIMLHMDALAHLEDYDSQGLGWRVFGNHSDFMSHDNDWLICWFRFPRAVLLDLYWAKI